jgi:hypothetical protein
MNWQDWILTIGGIVLSLSLIPYMFHEHKPPKHTSICSFVVLLVFSVCYATFGFWLTAVFTFITSVCWLILLIQSLNLKFFKEVNRIKKMSGPQFSQWLMSTPRGHRDEIIEVLKKDKWIGGNI